MIVRALATCGLLVFAQCAAVAPEVAARVATTCITMDLPSSAFGGSRPGYLAEALVIPELGLRCVVAPTGLPERDRQYVVTITKGAWTSNDEPHREHTSIPRDLVDRIVALGTSNAPSMAERHSVAVALVDHGVVEQDPLWRIERYLNAATVRPQLEPELHRDGVRQ